MIGKDELDAAVAKLNPSIGATNATLQAFGAAETVPFLLDLFSEIEVDPDAIRGFGLTTLEAMVATPGGWDPRPFVEGLVHGILIGVLAAREEASDV